ncbi:hypothetical protein EXS53_00565 [Patescibacteria group bacterium]|nr:hypothetical protein [Patescibacteria group bacterium]
MNNYQKILQYHLDNNLKQISPKYAKSLNSGQKQELAQALKLNTRLSQLKVRDSSGQESLRQALGSLDSSADAKVSFISRVFKIHRLRIATTYVAVAAIVLAAGGFGALTLNKPKSDSLKTSSVSANGSIENIHNLNLVDAENDASQLMADNSADKAAAADLQSVSSADEVTNADF